MKSGQEHTTSRVYVEQEAWSLSCAALLTCVSSAATWFVFRRLTHGRLR